MFNILKMHNIGLNKKKKKSAFKVRARKFLGFMLMEQKIRANLAKCKVIIDMKSLTNVKEVQD